MIPTAQAIEVETDKLGDIKITNFYSHRQSEKEA
jgi:hypothetical protein